MKRKAGVEEKSRPVHLKAFIFLISDWTRTEIAFQHIHDYCSLLFRERKVSFRANQRGRQMPNYVSSFQCGSNQ